MLDRESIDINAPVLDQGRQKVVSQPRGKHGQLSVKGGHDSEEECVDGGSKHELVNQDSDEWPEQLQDVAQCVQEIGVSLGWGLVLLEDG